MLVVIGLAQTNWAADEKTELEPIFNGKDLTGWKVGGADAAFTVVDGAIQANGAPNAAHLFYDGPLQNHMFTNFDLKRGVSHSSSAR